MSREERAKALRDAGLSWAAIGRAVGVSRSHARRLCDPDVAASERVGSRDAKRRRTGVCLDCGGPTRYAGNRGVPGASPRCDGCSRVAQRKCDYDRIVSLRRAGLTQAQIAREVGCVQENVSRVLALAVMSVGRGGRVAA